MRTTDRLSLSGIRIASGRTFSLADLRLLDYCRVRGGQSDRQDRLGRQVEPHELELTIVHPAYDMT